MTVDDLIKLLSMYPKEAAVQINGQNVNDISINCGTGTISIDLK